MQFQRWCIYIDILGFSKLWESEQLKALGSLRKLMQAVYWIGTRVYSNEDERLFVHQMGDGFAIVSDFGEPLLERPIAIAIALMRSLASFEMFAAAYIAEGEFSDITGCYPKEVVGDLQDGHVVRLGAGLMTLSSVMGTAFIRAYSLKNVAPSGPFLCLSESLHSRIPDGVPVRMIESKGVRLLSIDWVRATIPVLSDIQQKAGLLTPSPSAIVIAVQNYFKQYPYIREKWSRVCDILEIDAGG